MRSATGQGMEGGGQATAKRRGPYLARHPPPSDLPSWGGAWGAGETSLPVMAEGSGRTGGDDDDGGQNKIKKNGAKFFPHAPPFL